MNHIASVSVCNERLRKEIWNDGVGHFSIVKRVHFRLSRFRKICSSGSFFDCQMGTFSIDKNNHLPTLLVGTLYTVLVKKRESLWHCPGF